MNKDKTTILIGGLLVGLYIGFALWLMPRGTDDFRMVAVFSMDEVDIVTYVWNLVSTDFQTEPSFKYGGAFYYVPAGALYVWSFFAPVTEQIVVIGVRLFCTLAGLGCLWVTYCLGREVFSQQAGLIAACLLGLSPEFLRWSVESHPDLPQLFFLLCGLFWICRYMHQAQPVWLALAGAGAGLAFGTKYAGIFLVPVLVFAVFGSGEEGSWKARFVDAKRWLHVVIIGGSFALAFALTNPFAIMDVSGFVKSLKAEGDIMRFGHHVREMSGAWEWLQMLMREGPLHYVVLLSVCVWCFRGVNWRKMDRRWWVLILWVIVFVGYLMGASALKFPRHLLPVIPCVLLFIGQAYHVLWEKMYLRLPFFLRWQGLMVVIAVGFSAESIITSAEFFTERLRRENTQEEIVVGKWLGETFPANTSILNDPYAYVPEKFQFVMGSIGMTYGIVCHFEPDLLLVRDATVSDYAKIEEADVARIGKDAFLERFFFYRFLQEGLIPTYRLYRDFGQIAVYQRTAPSTRPDQVTWRELMDKYMENRRYGMVADYWTMGFIHLTQGDTIEAKNAFEKARQGQNFNTRVFQHGIAMLALGQVDAARHAFRAALQASEDQSGVYRAQLRDELAIRFFQAGLYADARALAEQAVALNGQLKRALFTQAVSCVALGDIQVGSRLLEQAVLRFGKDPTGAPLLDWLISHGVQEQAAKNLREKFF